MSRVFKHIRKISNALILSLVILAGQFAPVAGLLQPQKAIAAPVCSNDTQGANDEPGQKDLTKLCVDYAGLPSSISTKWNWDETGTSGANSLDACSLFDTDGDGFINYAVCVTTTGDPASLATLTTYSCGDAKIDRCTTPTTPVSNGTTACTVAVSATNPFDGGDDAVASCVIATATVGGSTAKLVDVCSYPSQQPNSDPSDCVIIAENKAKIEVRKDLNPDSDAGLFDLKINGTVYADNVGDGGTTGEVVVDVKNSTSVTVLEAEGPSTDLANYTTTVICRDKNGTGSIVGQASPTGSDTRQLTITAPDQSDIVCVFTNTRMQGTINVTKVVINDNGGTKVASDFGFQVNGGTTTSFEADGTNSLTLAPGTYNVTEPAVSGYTTTYEGCSNIQLGNGQTVNCVITNNDQPGTLNVVKTVVNDNGGTKAASDFSFKVNNGNPVSFEADGTNSMTVNAGNYTVTEVADSGYETSYNNCSNISIPLGGQATCYVTNNDKPAKLIIKKTVINNDGGSANYGFFDIKLGNSVVSMSTESTNGSATTYTTGSQTVSAGQWTVSEKLSPEYSEGQWDCGAPAEMSGRRATSLNLANGQEVTCTITNNDIAPSVTINKIVDNVTYGGAAAIEDFILYLNSQTVTSGQTYSSFAAGSYTVSEDQLKGYELVDVSGDCIWQNNAISLLMNLGGSYTCTLTNRGVQPKLRVVKHVVNEWGQGKSASDFTMNVTGTNVSSPSFAGSENGIDLTLNAGSYSVSEGAHDGYDVSYSKECSGTVYVGDEKTCTVTNTAIRPKLVVVKTVINDNSGESGPSDFTIYVDGNNVSNPSFAGDASGTEVYLNVGEYSVSEGDHEGYDASYSKGCTGSVNLGETVYCYVTNDDQENPGIEVHKYGPAYAHEGEEVLYMFVVYNTGDTALSDITVEDNIAGSGIYAYGDYNDNGWLDTDEVWVYYANYVVPENQDANVDNTVVVCANDYGNVEPVDEYSSLLSSLYDDEQDTSEICDDDDHTLDVLHPSIHIEKSGPTTAKAGTSVEYTFAVTNTGDVALSDVQLSDELTDNEEYVSGDVNDNGLLDLDETWIYKASYMIPDGQKLPVYNEATVCGLEYVPYQEIRLADRTRTVIEEDEQTPKVCDSDDHTVKISVTIVQGELTNTGANSTIFQLVALALVAGAIFVAKSARKISE